jgi:hypothetical protein
MNDFFTKIHQVVEEVHRAK